MKFLPKKLPHLWRQQVRLPQTAIAWPRREVQTLLCKRPSLLEFAAVQHAHPSPCHPSSFCHCHLVAKALRHACFRVEYLIYLEKIVYAIYRLLDMLRPTLARLIPMIALVFPHQSQCHRCYSPKGRKIKIYPG